jgi:predicted nucleic acid-binding protein
VTVLDAYAVIAYLRGEASADEVRLLLEAGGAALTATGVAEVVDQLVRVVGVDEEEAALDLAELDLLEGIAVESEIGHQAGRLRARHYQRTRRPVSLADGVVAAAAQARGEAVATSDPHLLDVCHAEGVAMVVLAGSDGSRWSPPG